MSKADQIKDLLFKASFEGELSNADLVQIIEHCTSFLNLKTKTNYAKANRITYNGAKHRKTQQLKIDGKTFIIDND